VALKKSGLILFPDHDNFSIMSFFINELAKPQPVPGGGGAAAQTALTALALLTKVIVLETEREGLSPEQRETWGRMGLQAREFHKGLLRLRRRDGRAYLDWVKHRGGPAEGDYVRAMAKVPLEILSGSVEVMGLLLQAGLLAKKHLWPDLLAVAELLQGAGLAAGRIAGSNLSSIRDAAVRQRLAGDLRDQTVNLFGAVQRAAKLWGGR
jgi:formiminotetrahydrofolate cyclodeaminase